MMDRVFFCLFVFRKILDSYFYGNGSGVCSHYLESPVNCLNTFLLKQKDAQTLLTWLLPILWKKKFGTLCLYFPFQQCPICLDHVFPEWTAEVRYQGKCAKFPFHWKTECVLLLVRTLLFCDVWGIRWFNSIGNKKPPKHIDHLMFSSTSRSFSSRWKNHKLQQLGSSSHWSPAWSWHNMVVLVTLQHVWADVTRVQSGWGLSCWQVTPSPLLPHQKCCSISATTSIALFMSFPYCIQSTGAANHVLLSQSPNSSKRWSQYQRTNQLPDWTLPMRWR